MEKGLLKTLWGKRENAGNLNFAHTVFYPIKEKIARCFSHTETVFCKCFHCGQGLSDSFSKDKLWTLPKWKSLQTTFQIWWKWQKVPQKGRKPCGRIANNFSFSHSIFKRLVLQACQNTGLFEKGLKQSGEAFLPGAINVFTRTENVAGVAMFQIHWSCQNYFVDEGVERCLYHCGFTEIMLNNLYFFKQTRVLMTQWNKPFKSIVWGITEKMLVPNTFSIFSQIFPCAPRHITSVLCNV